MESGLYSSQFICHNDLMKDLSALFVYSESSPTGLIWKNHPYYKSKNGKVAGTKESHGYWQVMVDYKYIPCHRVVWVIHYGEIPAGLEIDHIDRNRRNNKLSNLRLVTRSQNMANKSMQKNNKSGFKGVSWSTCAKKWQAGICIKRKCVHIGYFASPIEANQAYIKKAIELFGDFSSESGTRKDCSETH